MINAKMGKILLESEIIKNNDYKWLADLLKQDKNHIVKYSQLDGIEESKRTFMTSSLFTKLYEVACDEWVIDRVDEDSNKLECSLCGEKNTMKKYYIRNKKSNKVLNVGSTCITNFRDIKGSNGKTKEEIDKEWEKQQRQKTLNDKYSGIIDKIDNWNKVIDEIPTIIKAELEEKYDNIYSEIQIKYSKFIKNKKVDYSIASEINALVHKGDEILQEIYKNIEKNKNSEWYITKEIKDWCYKERDKNRVIIGFLKDRGVVDWRSACRIYEKNFVDKILGKLEVALYDSNIKIEGFDEKNNCIIINLKDRNPYTDRIDLRCSYYSFMCEYGNIIFEEINNKNIDGKQFILQNSQIIDNDSLESSIYNIRYLLKKSTRKVYKWDIMYNEIIFFEDEDNYCIVKLKEFINHFKRLVFMKKLDIKDIEDINKYVLKKGQKISKENYTNTVKSREKTNKSMQVDYSKFV